ncbi:MAG: ASKHA domain-containing protein [Clostridiales bacterium]|jgi:uncharacterized 2Fe-2S/4Fe-4S cluster protein (DUF4445 family)|nr:ASKHA domain-containing protein [Clostridiales bacterium]
MAKDIKEVSQNIPETALNSGKTFVNVKTSGQTLTAEKGSLLSDVLRSCGIAPDMPCGGRGTCKKCAVKVSGKICLACQTKIEHDIDVETLNAQILSAAPAAVTAKKTKLTGNSMFTKYGLAADLGTTTICVSLSVREPTKNEERIYETFRKNPQAAFGADVISRLDAANRMIANGEAEKLAVGAVSAINEMTLKLCGQIGILPEEIDAAVITGNTAMLYLLTGKNPKSLIASPFIADSLFGEYLSACELNLVISKNARVYLPRCISAFAGADIITAILASGMTEKPETSLLADIGTNGEIALQRHGEIFCASASAGPAFEGSSLSCGSYAVAGAINKVFLKDGKIKYETIGGGAASGICASAVIDTLAVMLRLGIMDKTGFISETYKFTDGVFLTLKDIRQIQLAKGAIRAGIETLLETAGVKWADICAFYIAGGFGSYLNLNNAAAIGLIPPEILPAALRCAKLYPPGNLALAGAQMILREKSLAAKTEEIAKRAKTVQLSANPVFEENFMKYISF